MANKGQDIFAAERRILAVEYRKTGANYRQIADILTKKGYPCSHSQVIRDVKRALRSLAKLEVKETAELRQLEMQRLDALQLALWNLALKGQIAAVLACLSIIEKRIKLFGLNAPEKHEITGKNGKPIETNTRVILPSDDEDG